LETIILCGRQNITVCGHDESNYLAQPGNFSALLVGDANGRFITLPAQTFSTSAHFTRYFSLDARLRDQTWLTL